MTRIRTLSRLATFASAACAIALVGVATPAAAAGGIKAAYVEQVIPAHTYTGHMTVLNSTTSVGPGTGVLGITSLTLTNFDTQAQQVFIFVPVYAGAGCVAGWKQKSRHRGVTAFGMCLR